MRMNVMQPSEAEDVPSYAGHDFSPNIPLLDFERDTLEPLYRSLDALSKKASTDSKEIESLKREIFQATKSTYTNLTHWNLTQIARHPNRPYALDYVDSIFKDFTEMHGDRHYGDDASIVCGFGRLEDLSVVLVLQQKGRSTEEKIKRNFGMPQPEGYRKALRMFEFAKKFKKPIVSLIDTPGAYPGIGGEERSQGEAIAKNLKVMAGLDVPFISVVIGEGGSGGALGIGVANVNLMMEYAIYSVISPESCASILWRSADKKVEAALALKNDAKTAHRFGIIDTILNEPVGGAHRNWTEATKTLKEHLLKNLLEEKRKPARTLIAERMHKYRQIGHIRSLKETSAQATPTKS